MRLKHELCVFFVYIVQEHINTPTTEFMLVYRHLTPIRLVDAGIAPVRMNPLLTKSAIQQIATLSLCA